MSKIAVGLSGGVDSAVTAFLLRDAGHEVVGVHLYCYPAKSEVEKDGLTRAEWIKKNGCRADEDKKFALKTALELEIPFKVLDFSEEYNRRVVDYFYREYEAGRTPNPDVLCNSEIKFGLFLDWALGNNFDFIATGHYAKIITSPSAVAAPPSPSIQRGDHRLSLGIPKDHWKDQTYFLWKLTQKELAHVLFPLGDLEKSEVRKMAQEAGLSVATRPDSQGICFVGNVAARKFLARRLKVKKGEVKNISGEVIGTHDGIWFYTIGQRGGWTIKPEVQALISRTRDFKNSRTQDRERITPVFYVIGKDAKKNELVVGLAEEATGERFRIGETNWIGQIWPIGQISKKILVRIRHGGKLISATLSRNEVTLEEPQRGVAPGQSAVFYSENGELLGGGVIE